MNVERFGTISTCHIPEAATKSPELGFTLEMPRVTTHQYGWIVFLVTDEHRPVPDWFEPILKEAKDQGITLVIFDNFGEVLTGRDDREDITTYKW